MQNIFLGHWFLVESAVSMFAVNDFSSGLLHDEVKKAKKNNNKNNNK